MTRKRRTVANARERTDCKALQQQWRVTSSWHAMEIASETVTKSRERTRRIYEAESYDAGLEETWNEINRDRTCVTRLGLLQRCENSATSFAEESLSTTLKKKPTRWRKTNWRKRWLSRIEHQELEDRPVPSCTTSRVVVWSDYPKSAEQMGKRKSKGKRGGKSRQASALDQLRRHPRSPCQRRCVHVFAAGGPREHQTWSDTKATERENYWAQTLSFTAWCLGSEEINHMMAEAFSCDNLARGKVLLDCGATSAACRPWRPSKTRRESASDTMEKWQVSTRTVDLCTETRRGRKSFPRSG